MRMVLAMLALLAVTQRTAAAEASPQRIERLLRELDDERFVVRQRAEAELTKIGLPVIPALLRAIKTPPSAEVRVRARRIVRSLQRARLREGFGRLSAFKQDERIDLLEGMWLISLIVDPLASREKTVEQLNAYAAAVRKKLGPGVDPATADPRDVVKALREVLFTDAGFTGNAADYDNPDNSALSRVLATKKGLPILLSHVVVAVAQRLKVPMVGLQVPSQYMVKYDGKRAPEGFPKDDIVLNPYDGGQIVSNDEIKAIVERLGFEFDPQQHLRPSGHRDTITRMLRNLLYDYQQAGLSGKAAEVETYLGMMMPGEE